MHDTAARMAMEAGMAATHKPLPPLYTVQRREKKAGGGLGLPTVALGL